MSVRAGPRMAHEIEGDRVADDEADQRGDESQRNGLEQRTQIERIGRELLVIRNTTGAPPGGTRLRAPLSISAAKNSAARNASAGITGAHSSSHLFARAVTRTQPRSSRFQRLTHSGITAAILPNGGSWVFSHGVNRSRSSGGKTTFELVIG